VAKTPPEARRERLAAALRANLKRRKTGGRVESGNKAGMADELPARPDEGAAKYNPPLPRGEPR
jgi:hypothetical protein